ncbi:MAG TPA: hypothetical protein VGZ00_08020 [Candidatus Baltobacteraceae bacterium]|jgi:DNA primase|nr:hypothetical protein [Candidatus Baltobacteraceae bacterium]
MSTLVDDLASAPDAKQRVPILLAHYERALPYLLTAFGGTPLVTVFYPYGLDAHGHFVGEIHKPLPHKIPTLAVHSTTGTHPYVALTADALEWLIRERHAVGFASWAPTRSDPTRVGYARISLHPINLATQVQVAAGVLALRAALRAHALDAIPMFDGDVSATLWIPFADVPAYPPVLAWLTAFAAQVVAAHQDLLTLAADAEAGDRVRLVVATNRVGRFSSLPYSIGGTTALAMVTPLRWEEVGTFVNGSVTVENSAQRIATVGDVFGKISAQVGSQRFRELTPPTRVVSLAPSAPAQGDVRGSNLRAAVAILQDGKTRSVDEILSEAIARGLLPSSVTRKHLYIALVEYISRTRGNGREPRITQDVERNFRINRPSDDWPNVREPLATPKPIEHADALVAALRASGGGDDPSAFEQAVCDAFAALGFVATHEGGNDKPDGYLDAPLGPLGYRVMLECKTVRGTSGKVTQPDAVEAARWCESYHAQHAVLIGPSFGDDAELVTELRTHGVSAWTIADVATTLSAAIDPFTLQAAFAPGFAEDALTSILWERAHGRAKRVRVISEMLVEIGAREQRVCAGDPSDAPAITEDAAMLLIDDCLRDEGSTAYCVREDVRAAFDYLTHPLVGRAVRTGENAIVIVVESTGSSA